MRYVAIRCTERLEDAGVAPSVGSRGDSYDNALAEAFNSLYEWEVAYRQGPWYRLEDVEHATMEHVHCFNHERIHYAIDKPSPAVLEAAYHANNEDSEQPRQIRATEPRSAAR